MNVVMGSSLKKSRVLMDYGQEFGKGEGSTSLIASTPDVLFIGFRRAGSTFLRSYFDIHPDIHWTREGKYFLLDELYEKTAYRTNIDKNALEAAKCRIDMDEHISIGWILKNYDSWSEICYNPRNIFDGKIIRQSIPQVAQRIKSSMPNVKILILLRNQINWLRSNYTYFGSLLPTGSKRFVDYLSTYEGKMALFAGQYHYTLESYFAIFGKQNVHVMLLEQFINEETESLKVLCEFLRVPFILFPSTSKTLNKSGGNAYVNSLKIASKFKIKDSILKSIPRPISNSLSKYLNYDCLSRSEKSFLQSYFSVSNLVTSELLDIDLGKYGYPL